MAKKWTKEGATKLLNAIMFPNCLHCSDTGVVPGKTFDSEKPQTYNDFWFCMSCDIGVNLSIEEITKEVGDGNS